MRDFEEVRFIDVAREFNAVVDQLAKECRKHVVEHNELNLYPQSPNACIPDFNLFCNMGKTNTFWFILRLLFHRKKEWAMVFDFMLNQVSSMINGM